MSAAHRPPRRFRRSRWSTADGILAAVAERPLERLTGLSMLGSGRGCPVLLPGCRAVHTFGMRFPVDVIFLDDSGRAIRRERGVRPRRFLREPRAAAVLEVPSESGAECSGREGAS